MTFGSQRLSVHLARGLGGFGALWAALAFDPASHGASLALILPAVWALKGCPLCWTAGLVETLAMKLHALADRPKPSA